MKLEKLKVESKDEGTNSTRQAGFLGVLEFSEIASLHSRTSVLSAVVRFPHALGPMHFE